MKSEAITEVLKASPAVAAYAVTLNDIVAILGAVYIAIQAAYLLRKWWREEKERQSPP